MVKNQNAMKKEVEEIIDNKAQYMEKDILDAEDFKFLNELYNIFIFNDSILECDIEESMLDAYNEELYEILRKHDIFGDMKQIKYSADHSLIYRMYRN